VHVHGRRLAIVVCTDVADSLSGHIASHLIGVRRIALIMVPAVSIDTETTCHVIARHWLIDFADFIE
jgi:hypothetical protein